MNTRTTHFYNRFAFAYPLVHVFLLPQKRKLIREINLLPPGKLLEIGVGNGSHLHQYRAHQITGIDTSVKMIEIARKQNAPHIDFRVMNGEKLLFPNQSFAYVVLSHVIAVVDNPDQLLQEAHRVLKSNGKLLILNHFTPDNWLRYVDSTFQIFSRIFHFQSRFNAEQLDALKAFTLEKEVTIKPFSYFKLLIYCK